MAGSFEHVQADKFSRALTGAAMQLRLIISAPLREDMGQVMVCRREAHSHVRTPRGAPAWACRAPVSGSLLACVTGAALNLLHNLIQVEGLGSLQWWEGAA